MRSPGIKYDPTKWIIWLWKQVGLAHNLKVFRQNEIEKGRLQQQQKKLDLTLADLRSTKLQLLPVMEWNEYQDEVLKGRSWLTIAGVVYDVRRFVKEHPGGKSMIYSGIGKDATAMFNGGVYKRKLPPFTARSGSPLTISRTQMLPINFSPLCTLALSVAVVRSRS